MLPYRQESLGAAAVPRDPHHASTVNTMNDLVIKGFIFFVAAAIVCMKSSAIKYGDVHSEYHMLFKHKEPRKVNGLRETSLHIKKNDSGKVVRFDLGMSFPVGP